MTQHLFGDSFEKLFIFWISKMFQISGVLLLNAKSFFYDGIEPKIGFEEYGLSLEIEIYLQWPINHHPPDYTCQQMKTYYE